MSAKSAKKDVREVSLPEGIEIQQMSAEEVRARVSDYAAKQEEGMKKRIADRVERFEAKLRDKDSLDAQVLSRKLTIQLQRAKIKEAREAIAMLQNEIKALRPVRRRNKKEKAE